MTTGTSDGWIAAACWIRGAGHCQRDIPCQDRASAWTRPRPCLLVLDGIGSAAMSHVGVRAATLALRRFIRESETHMASILDSGGDALAALAWHGFAIRVYHVAALTQAALAVRHDRPPKDFEFTLSLAIVGARRTGWLAVGDSPLLAIRHRIAGLLCPPEDHEFAGQTASVRCDPQPAAASRCGLIPTSGMDALCAMSDGAASRLIDQTANTPAEAIRQITQALAARQWTAADLRAALCAPAWDRATHDDRSMALLVQPPTL